MGRLGGSLAPLRRISGKVSRRLPGLSSSNPRCLAVVMLTALAGREREVCRGARAASGGSYLRLINSCITHLKAQGPAGTCNESKEER